MCSQCVQRHLTFVYLDKGNNGKIHKKGLCKQGGSHFQIIDLSWPLSSLQV